MTMDLPHITNNKQPQTPTTMEHKNAGKKSKKNKKEN